MDDQNLLSGQLAGAGEDFGEGEEQFEGGNCSVCKKKTDAFCDRCNAWVCSQHMVKPDPSGYECFCQPCFSVINKTS